VRKTLPASDIYPQLARNTDTQLRSNIVVETDAQTRGRSDAQKMNVLRMNATWYERG